MSKGLGIVLLYMVLQVIISMIRLKACIHVSQEKLGATDQGKYKYNYCLFCPIWDYLGGVRLGFWNPTLDEDSGVENAAHAACTDQMAAVTNLF